MTAEQTTHENSVEATDKLMQRMQSLMRASMDRDREAFLSHFDDNVVYILHTSVRPLEGIEWVGRFVDRYFKEMTDLLWRIDRWASNGNKLLVEGYEEYTERHTGKRVGHPYMGIVEFNDRGLIIAMRDYFEMDGKPLND
ncbi:MAG: nuclear transport factor 2 family protein [Proteobacteria bacterium]|nr:nuclear transport factor 2 family protein [Pseudomonadota bacterium]